MSDKESTDLFSLAYGELRRIAAAQIARMPPAGSTLQPTALVHEAWIRFANQASDWESRAHLLSAAAEAMRHILIDRARKRHSARHGGGQQRISVDEMDIPVNLDNDDAVLAINDAIADLGVEYPDAALLAKLRCFGGFEVNEAAQALGIPRATAFRRWRFARAWLHGYLRKSTETPQE
ncbi:RNA polymerase sigma factor (TIGR02999 family) [Povalibacter uvarum]|uniref:RNA polymerase sigma factor (TIGR02999 family) n=1 Tax=Povalibacter uvarum TaxID=732238 RepID=A0A841HNA7_9GAMM|nr:ECF-type sigma factor [Povalibacter uvarum]MBB6093648.1 RNA polymerase sigma factor (TIGR02999 family) [Povalibacter uvarum]